MTLKELKEAVDLACEMADDYKEKLEDIQVSIQLDFPNSYLVVDSGIELHYDGNCNASGCVLQAYVDKD